MKNIMILIVGVIVVGSAHGGVILDVNFDQHAVDQELATNVTLYDYTRNAAFVPANAVDNTLAFKGGSATDYVIKNKGVGHEKAMYLTGGVNTSTDTGMYLVKLDMSGNGANSMQETRVSWSFDILGTSDDVDFNPTGWTITLNYGNTSTNLTMTDNWFNTANNGVALAQTFDFVNAGKNGTVGWVTVSGYFDIAVGEASNLGAIQIRGHNGGFVSSDTGGFAVDNIKIDVSAVPEPATIGLFGIGAAGALLLRRRSKR